MKVAVIGGGISGLTTAFLLKKKGIGVTVFESAVSVGGNVQTIEKDGYKIELGPNSLFRSPRMVDLVRMIGLEDEVVAANPAAKKRYILWKGKLEAMGPGAFVNGYFSPKALFALLREPFVRSKSPANQSVAEFVSRRLNSEFVDKALDPFISGIYAGDASDLSVCSAFPKLYALERDFGSVIIGVMRNKSERPAPNFPRTFSFRGGIRTLIQRLAAEIGDGVCASSPVEKIEDVGNRQYRVNGDEFDAVVISTPAWTAANLIRVHDEKLADALSKIVYAPVAVAVTGFRAEQVGKRLDGFGFLIPSKEKRPILGTLFNSAVFPGREPEGRQLLTTFIGGVRDNGRLDQMSDEEIRSLVTTQLQQLLDIKGEPEMFYIKRWKHAIPQYRLNYEQVTSACGEFEKQHPGLYFCSNFYRGISIGDCIKNAFQTADDVESFEQ